MEINFILVKIIILTKGIMIGCLRGSVYKILENQIYLSTISGIFFEVYVTNSVSYQLNKEVLFYTYFHWNQEQGPSIFGFGSEQEKVVFILIISCTGIGPKMALSILNHLQPNDFLKAIQDQDIQALSSVSGIGAKKAEQMIVQLKHKVSKIIDSGLADYDPSLKKIKELADVLGSLNYSRIEINSAVEYSRKSSSSDLSFDQLLRKALSFLSKKV